MSIVGLIEEPRQVLDTGECDRQAARYADLVEATSDWIWEVDAKGRYSFSNRRVMDILGYTPEEVMGRTPFDFMPPGEAERMRALFMAVAEQKTPFSRLENVNLHKDGHEVVLETSGVPVLDGAGRLLGYRGIDRDVTDRRVSHDRLAEAYRFLERRVQERTKALSASNEHLEQAVVAQQRLLEEVRRAERAKAQFLAAASHDMRQPYQASLLFMEALRTRLTDGPEALLVRRAIEALEAGRELLDALSRVAALDAGLVTPRPAPASINAVMEETVREHRPLAAAKGVDVRMVPTSEVGLTDPALLRIAVGHFVSNAIGHARCSKVVVGCRRRGLNLRLEVWDNGRGLSPSELETVFEDFVQIDNPERDRRKGLGLGLGIVSRIGRLLNHSVQARSWPGRGSVFSLDIHAVREV